MKKLERRKDENNIEDMGEKNEKMGWTKNWKKNIEKKKLFLRKQTTVMILIDKIYENSFTFEILDINSLDK